MAVKKVETNQNENQITNVASKACKCFKKIIPDFSAENVEVNNYYNIDAM